MTANNPEIPVGPHYIWRDTEERGLQDRALVVGRKAKSVIGNLLARNNNVLHTEFLICDPNHDFGRLAMTKQGEKRITRLFEPHQSPLEIDPKTAEIRGIITVNRMNRYRGLGLEPGAMLVGPIVLTEVVEWARQSAEDGLPLTAYNKMVLNHTFADFDYLMAPHAMEEASAVPAHDAASSL